jgi:hypothetical protein
MATGVAPAVSSTEAARSPGAEHEQVPSAGVIIEANVACEQSDHLAPRRSDAGMYQDMSSFAPGPIR